MTGQSGVRRRLADSVLRQAAWGDVGKGQLRYLPGIWVLVAEGIPGSADFSSVSCRSTDRAIAAEIWRENSQPGISGLFDFEHVPSHPLSLSPHLTLPVHGLKNQTPKVKTEGPFLCILAVLGQGRELTVFELLFCTANVLCSLCECLLVFDFRIT